MGKLLFRKFVYACLSLLIVMTLTFVLMKSIPGNPFQQEQALPLEIYQLICSHYGLNDPIHIQYCRYIQQLLTFDFGPSLVYKTRNISEVIKDGFPTSAILGATALALAIPLGLLLGVVAAIKHRFWQDSLITMIAVLGLSIPSFILATLLQYTLAIKLELFPIARWGTFSHLFLPALSLAALPMAFIAKMTRIKMIEELKEGYVITARAKGLTEFRIIFLHVFKNTLIPILSYLGPLSANILTGSFIVEKIYGIPGLGYWFVASISNRDYPMIMGITIFYSILLLLISFFIDLVTLSLDPRIAQTARIKKT